MLLILSAILAVVAFFLLAAILVSAAHKNRPQPNYALLPRRYSYRNDPHADQTTTYPNRLHDNEFTDR